MLQLCGRVLSDARTFTWCRVRAVVVAQYLVRSGWSTRRDTRRRRSVQQSWRAAIVIGPASHRPRTEPIPDSRVPNRRRRPAVAGKSRRYVCLVGGAEERTRTSTPLREQAPEPWKSSEPTRAEPCGTVLDLIRSEWMRIRRTEDLAQARTGRPLRHAARIRRVTLAAASRITLHPLAPFAVSLGVTAVDPKEFIPAGLDPVSEAHAVPQ